MSDTIDPGEGWRLVDTNGVVSRVRTDSHPDPELDRLRSENADLRQQLAAAKAETDMLVGFFRHEGQDMGREGDRQNWSPSKTAIVHLRQLSSALSRLKMQTDYSIELQRAIEAHCRGERVTGDTCQHHADMLNADIELTEQRACEIVCQMRRRGCLEVSDESCGWFIPHGPDNWQCRPLEPKPVTITITCPPDKLADVKAAAIAAGGSV